MTMHADQAQRLARGGPKISVPCLCQGDAELVGAFPRGQIGVSLDVDVGIDAHRDGRLDLHLLSDGGDHLQFFARFHVQRQDLVLQRQTDFIVGLAHSRKGDFVRWKAGLQRLPQFTAGDHVRARAQGRQPAQQFGISVGLERIADPVGLAGQCTVDAAIVFNNPGEAVHIERRPASLGDSSQCNLFAIEFLMSIVKRYHARLLAHGSDPCDR
ncbi:MAG: hypothetical protein BWY83_02407 [bacterium ADurb.Bin478]|nr:MAG: hypothetical protein BWY83_02407 [bacterium ADurb.Bin478]